MRTNIEIDDKLMHDAMKVSGAATKRAAVEAALTLMIRLDGQKAIRQLRGTVEWEGDLEQLRLGRSADEEFGDARLADDRA